MEVGDIVILQYPEKYTGKRNLNSYLNIPCTIIEKIKMSSSSRYCFDGNPYYNGNSFLYKVDIDDLAYLFFIADFLRLAKGSEKLNMIY